MNRQAYRANTAVWAAVAAIVGASGSAVAGTAAGGSADPYAGLPTSVSLTGVLRDFRDRQTAGGHPDFNFTPKGGAGVYVGIVGDQLNNDGDPVFVSGGAKVSIPWTDAAKRGIIPPRSHIAARQGDVAGKSDSKTSGAVESAQTFASWFKNWSGINQSGLLTIELKRTPGTATYVFDGELDTKSANLEGSYDVNGKGGKAQGGNINRCYTYELETNFAYRKGAGSVLTFASVDDLWVFIDGKLVVDLGGPHNATAQSIELDRLTWLNDGTTYTMKVFYADRRKTASNLRIETTLELQPVQPPAVSGVHD